MADGGGYAGNSRSSAPLDGAFLLQLLRNPPQSQNRNQNQQRSPFDDPHRDPAVAVAGPTYPSAVLLPQETLTQQRLSPPNWAPPGFPPRAANNPHHFFPQNSTPPRANSHFPPFAHRDFASNSNPRRAQSNVDATFAANSTPRRAQSNVDATSAESSTHRDPHHRNHYHKGQNFSAGDLRFGSVPRTGAEWAPPSEKQHRDAGERNGKGQQSFDGDQDELSELMERNGVDDEFSESVSVKRSSSSRAGKEARIDLYRGHSVSSQRVRIRRREMECRYDIDSFSPLFLSIYKSLIPAEEEIEKRKQLLLLLRKLVSKEWPDAQLHLYGSCANSFGVSNSDIDICLAIDDSNRSKSDILLRLADILQSDNLQNVQALTHARVPIVKMMDPATGISCDICINNLLAVANTKLLSDYARIDERLRQLAFIVKHWAKSRGVNETYRGTLSSYAYVLMCIHFLQLRRPAILPCLQEMESTYAVTIDGNRYAYFDQVDRLRNFGAQNNENVAHLLWGFFHYWAYNHDYMNDVISIRTGRIISKRVKDWTRRIGNDRHLICIEDPFETSHDLGRVVDKFSIKILREEFERAADILQYDRNPGVTLFEPYVPRSAPEGLQLD